MTKEIDFATWDVALKLLAPIVSHEIRNPLAIIGNSSYFIKTKLGQAGKVDPKVLKHLGIIEEELGHANGTLGEILAYARMREPALQAHPLNSLAEAALAKLTPEPPVTLKTAFGPATVKVLADAELVTACIMHAVRNAFQSGIADKERPVNVTVATRADGSFGEVEVSDTGPGVPPEALPRMFEPFNTTKPRGIGLGLAFAKKVLMLHKGSIELVPGKAGAKFRIKVPLAS